MIETTVIIFGGADYHLTMDDLDLIEAQDPELIVTGSERGINEGVLVFGADHETGIWSIPRPRGPAGGTVQRLRMYAKAEENGLPVVVVLFPGARNKSEILDTATIRNWDVIDRTEARQ